MPPQSSPIPDSSHGNSCESLLTESSSALWLCKVFIGEKSPPAYIDGGLIYLNVHGCYICMGIEISM